MIGRVYVNFPDGSRVLFFWVYLVWEKGMAMPENWFNAIQPVASLNLGWFLIQPISDKSWGIVDDTIIPQLSRIILHNYVTMYTYYPIIISNYFRVASIYCR